MLIKPFFKGGTNIENILVIGSGIDATGSGVGGLKGLGQAMWVMSTLVHLRVVYFYPILRVKAAQNLVKICFYSQKLE